MSDARKPSEIWFFNNGQETGHYRLKDSHFNSLDDESYFTRGNPQQAAIVGPVDAQVSFFDDQQYRADENVLQIVLKRDASEANPVLVNVSYSRLGNGDHPNGIYSGEEAEFGWVLYKHAKANWTENVLRIAGKFSDLVNEIIGKVPGATQWQQYAVVAGIAIHRLQGFNTPGHSNNSQVDNISSVLFGSAPG